MKRFPFFVTFIILLINCKAQHRNSSDSIKKDLDKQIRSLYQELGLSGDFMLSVINNDGIKYSFTKSSKEATTKSLLNAPFYIASHTKAMTGTLLKSLEQKGMLRLDATIAEYLPELHFNKQIDPHTITIRNLLSHTHGIHNTLVTWKTAYLGYNGGNKELIEDFNQYSTFDSLRQFDYTNIGPIIAAIIAERVAGKDWRQLMNIYLFEPLQMHQTSGYVNNYKVKNLVPSTLRTKVDGSTSSGFYKSDQTMHAAGGIISTMKDLSHWLSFNINKGTWNGVTLFPEIYFAEMINPIAKQDVTYFTYKRFGYSLGWDLATYNGEQLATRFGGFGGTNVHISFLPEKGLAIVAYTNEERARRLPHIAANLAYNLLLKKTNAWELFEQEKEMYKKTLDQQEKPLPAASTGCSMNLRIEGTFTNEKGWPAIRIYNIKNVRWIQWGTSRTKEMQMYCKDNKIILFADFGAFQREFTLEENNGAASILNTSSLTFKR